MNFIKDLTRHCHLKCKSKTKCFKKFNAHKDDASDKGLAIISKDDKPNIHK